ncbi:MAG: DNA-binding CsgD family transcriptional regulator [Flavobacteriales bacterium]|jgi:DNA-binding CsgD family transcriptional regulator
MKLKRINDTYEAGNTTTHIGLLTHRQAQQFTLAGEGANNTEIADHMGISEHTVRVNWKNIYTALGVHNAAQAIAKAAHMGVIELRRISAALLFGFITCMQLAPAPAQAQNQQDNEPARIRGGRRSNRRARSARRLHKKNESYIHDLFDHLDLDDTNGEIMPCLQKCFYYLHQKPTSEFSSTELKASPNIPPRQKATKYACYRDKKQMISITKNHHGEATRHDV